MSLRAAAGGSRPEPSRDWAAAAIILHMGALGAVLGLTFPLTSLTLESWETPGWMIGLVSAAPALAILVAMPLAPALVERLGVAPTMLLGCAVGAAGVVLMPAAPSPIAWAALRFLTGAGLALPWLLGETWLNAVAEESRRGRLIAFYAAAFFAGFALGPPALDFVGGVEAGAAPFWLAAGGVAAAAAPLLAVARTAPALSMRSEGGVAAAMRAHPAITAGAFGAGAAETVGFALLPVFGVRAGLSESEALALLTAFIIGGIALQAPLGWIADRRPREHVLAVLAAASIALAALLPAAAAPERLALALIAAFALGGAVLGFYSVSLMLLGERFAAADLATANAAFLIAYQLGGLAGPSLAGAAMTAAPALGAPGVVALSGALILAVILARRR